MRTLLLFLLLGAGAFAQTTCVGCAGSGGGGSFTAAGDLSGSSTSQTVSKVSGPTYTSIASDGTITSILPTGGKAIWNLRPFDYPANSPFTFYMNDFVNNGDGARKDTALFFGYNCGRVNTSDASLCETIEPYYNPGGTGQMEYYKEYTSPGGGTIIRPFALTFKRSDSSLRMDFVSSDIHISNQPGSLDDITISSGALNMNNGHAITFTTNNATALAQENAAGNGSLGIGMIDSSNNLRMGWGGVSNIHLAPSTLALSESNSYDWGFQRTGANAGKIWDGASGYGALDASTFIAHTLVSSPALTLTGAGTITTAITGSTQCLHVNSAGVISGTGADCGSGGSLAIGSSIGSATANDVLFVGSGPVLAQSGNFTFNTSTSELLVTGKIRVAGATSQLQVEDRAGGAGFLLYNNSNIFRFYNNGDVLTIDSSGIIKPGGYKSSDGTAGMTGTCASTTTLTVKNGLITGCS